MKKIINTTNAPAAIGPYSQAVLVGNMLYISGQIGLKPENGELLEGVILQARRAFENMKAILTEAGADFSNVVKTTVFLVDMSDFAEINKIYAEYFTENFPARSTVAVLALPKGASFEIEAVACL